MNEADEHELVLRSKQGDLEAYGLLVQRHQNALFNTAWRVLGNRQDAEDAAQEAFIRAYRAFASFDAARPLAPWLKRVTVNICLNRIEALPEAALSLDEETFDASQPAPGPEMAVEQGELSGQVWSAIQRLSPRYRAAIELRHFQELSYSEMAETLQRPLSDVKSDLFRARKLLAGWLQAMRTEPG